MKKYGLIGKNISYSFSEKYFSEKFAREGISDCSYRIFDIQDIENVKDILADSDICGLNVTIPYKVEIMSLLDEISDEARQIGAVNTVKVSPDGHLSGYNSGDIPQAGLDAVEAFLDALKSRNKKALLRFAYAKDIGILFIVW